MAVLTLLYDESLAGFFSAVFAAYTAGNAGSREKPLIEIRRCGSPEAGLFEEMREVETNTDEARRVLEGIRRKMGRRGLNTITRAFLSERKDCENTIYRFIRKGMKEGEGLLDRLTDPDALKVMEMSRKTMKEYHRFLGLLRFRKLDTGEYYAPFKPDTNLLPLLGRHFASRFPDQPWMIHDRRRETALIHIGGKLELTELRLESESLNDPVQGKKMLATGLEIEIKRSESEDPYAELWKLYHKKIGIEERANPKLQQQFMPKKHWEFLPEMEAAIDP